MVEVRVGLRVKLGLIRVSVRVRARVCLLPIPKKRCCTLRVG